MSPPIMQSLGSRQVPSPSPDPTLRPRPVDAIQINLDTSTSTTTNTRTDTSAAFPIPSPLTQLFATKSTGMATEMAESSTPQSAPAIDEAQSNMSPTDSIATATATPTPTTTGPTQGEKGKGVAPISTTPLSKPDSATDETSALSSTLSSDVDSTKPYCLITLLLTSGARHGFKVDEKYLSKRNTTIPGVTGAGQKDPYSISVYTLKELILREWREEWDAKPTSPSSIRLIYFGRLLKDNMPLEECKFNKTAKNVVHMTVRPQDIVDEEEEERKRAEGRQQEETEPTARCGCIIL